MTTTTLSTELSPIEMDTIEQEIERDRHSFLRMGANLIRVREGRGYKLRGYKTFEEYCDRKWGISDRHGRRLIEAAETAEKTQATLGAAPSSESVARELKKVADNPTLLQKVAAKLERKKTTIATATAEQVAGVVADVTGTAQKSRPVTITQPQQPPAIQPVPLATHDTCPQCRIAPKAYENGPNGWYCGNCFQLVNLNVSVVLVSTSAKTCRVCNFLITPGASLCANCGAIVK